VRAFVADSFDAVVGGRPWATRAASFATTIQIPEAGVVQLAGVVGVFDAPGQRIREAWVHEATPRLEQDDHRRWFHRVCPAGGVVGGGGVETAMRWNSRVLMRRVEVFQALPWRHA